MHKDSADFGAVKAIKEEDMYDETDLDSPSNAIKLGFDLKRLILTLRLVCALSKVT